MISQKLEPLTRRATEDAYDLATLRDDDTCQRCGRDCGPVARDHRQNRDPFNTVVENLQCLGLTCHQWKTEHPASAWGEGWGVPRWAKPAQYPARRWIRTEVGTHRLAWVLYVTDIEYFEYAAGYREISDDEALDRISGLHQGVRR